MRVEAASPPRTPTSADPESPEWRQATLGKVRRYLHREWNAKQRRVLELLGQAAAVDDVYSDLVTLHAACRTLQADIERVDFALSEAEVDAVAAQAKAAGAAAAQASEVNAATPLDAATPLEEVANVTPPRRAARKIQAAPAVAEAIAAARPTVLEAVQYTYAPPSPPAAAVPLVPPPAESKSPPPERPPPPAARPAARGTRAAPVAVKASAGIDALMEKIGRGRTAEASAPPAKVIAADSPAAVSPTGGAPIGIAEVGGDGKSPVTRRLFETPTRATPVKGQKSPMASGGDPRTRQASRQGRPSVWTSPPNKFGLANSIELSRGKKFPGRA